MSQILWDNDRTADASPFNKAVVDNDVDYKEIVVCTPKDKDLSKTYVLLPNISYLARAKALFDRMSGAGGFDHFGCNRERVE